MEEIKRATIGIAIGAMFAFLILVVGCTPAPKCDYEYERRTVLDINSYNKEFFGTAKCILTTDKGKKVYGGSICYVEVGESICKAVLPAKNNDYCSGRITYNYWRVCS